MFADAEDDVRVRPDGGPPMAPTLVDPVLVFISFAKRLLGDGGREEAMQQHSDVSRSDRLSVSVSVCLSLCPSVEPSVSPPVLAFPKRGCPSPFSQSARHCVLRCANRWSRQTDSESACQP
eukprot:Selendium_serpulae@DN3448_c0_g1_i3.p1